LGRETRLGDKPNEGSDTFFQSVNDKEFGSASHDLDDGPDQGPARLGLFVLADKAGDEAGVVDIIAIHGLNGHYLNTWTAVSKLGTECNWLKDLLPNQIPNARIMSFGYNSAVQFSKSAASIGSFAEDLLEDIMSRRETTAEKARPIIFICHSLGGIVFKKV
jgi:hypothetical protein